jgi:molybdate transport system regulatory protein
MPPASEENDDYVEEAPLALPVPSWLPAASDRLFNERLRWLMRAVAVPGVLPVRPAEMAVARAAVQELNNLAHEPLAEWVAGDVGQGLRLTARGRRLSVALLVLRRNQERLLSQFGVDFAEDVRLLDRVLVRTSARNQLIARVQAIDEGRVQDRVVLELPGHRRFGALITRNSAAMLGIRPGSDVVALIKASAMSVIVDGSDEMPYASHNRLRGSIATLHGDEEFAELSVDLGGGLTAVAALAQPVGEFVRGQNVWLAFHPSSVIIGIVA